MANSAPGESWVDRCLQGKPRTLKSVCSGTIQRDKQLTKNTTKKCELVRYMHSIVKLLDCASRTLSRHWTIFSLVI